jgi:hypothetical protein
MEYKQLPGGGGILLFPELELAGAYFLIKVLISFFHLNSMKIFTLPPRGLETMLWTTFKLISDNLRINQIKAEEL